MKTVVLGTGLEQVDDFAFTNCDGLESVTIPENIKRIGISAFADCDNFEDITIPPQVTDISEDAFDGDYLLNIHCEEGSYADRYAQDFYDRQKEMAVYSKSDRKDSVKVEIPKDGVYSGADAVLSGDEISGEDTQPDGEAAGKILGSSTVVGNQALVFMQNAEASVWNGSKKDSVQQAEENTEDTAVTVVNGTVVERAYYRNTDIKELAPENVRMIDRFAYARSSLEKIVLPEGLEEIGYAAFYHCDELKDVIIPESVMSVSAKAFSYTAWVNDFLKGESKSTEDDFLISGGVLIAYRGHMKEVDVPEGVRVIAGGAFEGHLEIEKIVLPASVINIDELAFDGCSPKEVKYLGEAMDENLVESRVSIVSLSSAPAEEKKIPITWIAAAIMLICGCACFFSQVSFFRKEPVEKRRL